MPVEYAAFIVIAFASSLVSAVFGIGTALVLLALGATVLPVQEVVALCAVMFLASGLFKTLLFRRSVNWNVAIWVSLGSLPFAFLGASLVDAIPESLLRRMLGFMVLAYVAASIRSPLMAIPTHRIVVFLGSGLYGFLSGLLGSGSVIKAILFRQLAIAKDGFVGIMAATSILTNIAKLTAYTRDGLLHPEHFTTMGWLVAAAILSALIGKNLLQRLSLRGFKTGVMIVLTLAGGNLLLGFGL